MKIMFQTYPKRALLYAQFPNPPTILPLNLIRLCKIFKSYNLLSPYLTNEENLAPCK